MRILITGGNGYIARSLYSSLSKNHRVTKITRADFDLSNSSETAEWFVGKEFDAVIHTAITGGSRLHPDESSVLEKNLLMHYNLHSCRGAFSRFIGFGSGAELFAPDTPYGMSKKIIANSIKQTANWHNIRIFGVFDENELPTRFIKSNILRYANREPMLIHENKVMDFFYMEDLVALISYYLTESNPPKETNCSYSEKTTLVDIASYINKLSDYEVPVVIESDEKFGIYCGKSIGVPIYTVGLRQGIQKTYKALTLPNQKR
jgi:nucleoside-diphosphate-sugar epimerase